MKSIFTRISTSNRRLYTTASLIAYPQDGADNHIAIFEENKKWFWVIGDKKISLGKDMLSCTEMNGPFPSMEKAIENSMQKHATNESIYFN